jgi:hypothetical protein
VYQVGYYISATAAGLSLAAILCLIQPRDARADDPGPDDPVCQNKGLQRKCDNMCSQSPNCKGDNLCKKDGAGCTNCICRIYKWGPPINAENCECQKPPDTGGGGEG